MAVLKKRCSLSAGICLLVAFAAASAGADEIRLKDGKKLYGVIVAYEDNMFKVKTDFGFVLVEKDKIASIIPVTPAAKADVKPEAKPEAKPATKKETPSEAPREVAPPAPKPASVTSMVPAPADRTPETSGADVKTPAPAAPKNEKTPAKAAVKPAAPPPASAAPKETPPASTAAASNPAPARAVPPPPAKPKEPEVAVNREEIQGNLYINHTYNFRMFKAPSWRPIDNALQALPNAVVAMGTSDESTLLIIGREKSRETLEASSAAVESRLREVYTNYRRISQRKTVVGGLPASEIRYRGMADERDWSGTLVVVARGSETFTVLGMTFADTDLIQIQENVISRAIASLDFSTP